ncbi:MAG TPA: DUF4870 domain-containing protein [Chiayiivirga sp.]|nr:DUF4870 domain-containing protein [Chiayiivirga sp.]
MSDIENTPPPSPPPPPATPPPQGDTQDRQWAMFAHLSALVGIIIPFGNIIAPLIIWQVKKDQFPLVDDQGKEALNFNIAVTLAFVVAFILMFVLIGFVLMPLIGIAWLVFVILAAIKANEGVNYRYPVNLRLIK